ncbi:unnamed protein product [Rotaria sp. Silwood1]|nr:unnamed protein product [Rotaria sp. Silwood1]
MQHSNSILIVEDAEHIILDRKQETFLPKQAVSNLLNLSDGLLGDAMHQQIICTFNCDVQAIDPALLRDGRLVIEHKFDKLSVENARHLCVELNIPGNGEDIHEPTILAEIYARKNAAAEASPKFVTKNECEAIALRRGQEEAAENDRERERRESDHYRREKR